MKRALTAEQARHVEGLAVAGSRLSIGTLMENAGAALAQAAMRLATPQGRFVVLCGVGNNGGDGLVAARYLKNAGRMVQVELIGERARMSPETARNLESLKDAGTTPTPIPPSTTARPGDVVVDALFGTGLKRPLVYAAAEAVQRIAAWRGTGAMVLAADLPSGLPSDGAAPEGPCVQADATMTFGVLKVGQLTAIGAERCGDIQIAPIGLPPEMEWALTEPGVFLLEPQDAREALPVRAAESNKGSYGHVLVVAGSDGKTGAATLCARGVLRAGAGRCTVATRPNALLAVMAGAPELMGAPLVSAEGNEEGEALGLGDVEALGRALSGKRAWVVGPGIPRGPTTAELLTRLLAEHDLPCVIDADGLNALVGRVASLRRAAGPVVLTPHPGEMARLLETEVSLVQADRFTAARTLADRTRATVVLKGSRTLIAAPDGRIFINPTGNPGMATAGTGDVLAGLCAGLLAQGILPAEAACTAVFAHGLAGDRAAQRQGQLGVIASDLLETVGGVWAEWGR